ncbi:MAG: hypothetical protein ACR2PL_12810 [Dehalococcoidia bacterium]
MSDPQALIHLFIMSHAIGETMVFLVEREPGIVEFPTLATVPASPDSEAEIIRQVEVATGLTVALGGFLEPPADALLSPAGSRFLLARHLRGTPRINSPHVGWEWRPGSSLLSLQFVPRTMADELRLFMNV